MSLHAYDFILNDPRFVEERKKGLIVANFDLEDIKGVQGPMGWEREMVIINFPSDGSVVVTNKGIEDYGGEEGYDENTITTRYINDMKNGEEKREKVVYGTSRAGEMDEYVIPVESSRSLEITTYANDVKNGPYTLMSTSDEGLDVKNHPTQVLDGKRYYITERGDYLDGARDGDWFENGVTNFYINGNIVDKATYEAAIRVRLQQTLGKDTGNIAASFAAR